MHTWGLDDLIREYEGATSKDDILIKMKLNNIKMLLSNCEGDEMVFANEISAEFCRLIYLLQEKNQSKIDAVEKEFSGNFAKHERQSFMTVAIDQKAYKYAWELQEDFYDFFRDKEKYPAGYIEVLNTPVSERKGIVCLTLMDYISRIKSFAKYDLEEMYSVNAIPHNLDDRFLFIYDNIESIIASFDASSDNETDKKRKLNMRSALRKLNDFKYGRRTK